MKEFELKTIIGKPTEKSMKLRDEIIKLAFKIVKDELGIEEYNIKFHDIGVIDKEMERWIITGENLATEVVFQLNIYVKFKK